MTHIEKEKHKSRLEKKTGIILDVNLSASIYETSHRFIAKIMVLRGRMMQYYKVCNERSQVYTSIVFSKRAPTK